MWFSSKNLKKCETILVDDLHGYVLPHAGTQYTGDILSHTLQFKPKKLFTTVVILYYPASKRPNIENRYYHEFFVPWKTLEYVISSFWNITREITFVGFNVRDEMDTDTIKTMVQTNLQNILFVVSADFSHYLPLQEALTLENCSAHGLMQRDFSNLNCMEVVDKDATFELFYTLIPQWWMLQWVGRTRSGGKEPEDSEEEQFVCSVCTKRFTESATFDHGVGYLSFLLREMPDPEEHPPASVFITALDGKMRQRECLGNWFSASEPWTEKSENTLLDKVVHKANTTSRLLPGETDPVTHYTVAYLYEDTLHPFIRGWHGIRSDAFYLPDVFLEHTFNNGTWITSQDRVWERSPQKCLCHTFEMGETLEKLSEKARVVLPRGERQPYTLYRAHVFHSKLSEEK